MKRSDFLKTLGLIGISPFFFNMKNINEFYNQANSWKNTPKMPVLFLGHGSPMNALEDNQFVRGFKNIVKKIHTPKAILCISAHWETKGTKVTAMETPKTIHDFGGFPQELFDIQYPAKGSPELAKEAANILKPVKVDLDEEWGLDHGAWTVIMHLYPNAEIPVIQMSLDYTKSADYHFELAQKLSILRRKGILIIGSGNIVHNLGRLNFDENAKAYDWALEARETINNHINDRNFKPLLSYHNKKALKLAIPTPEHYLPLLYTLALQDKKNDEMSLFNDEIIYGGISMTSIFMG